MGDIMKESTANSMGDLLSSISNIGGQSKELEFKSKKIVEKLRKNRIALVQDSFDSAFDPNNNDKG
jgi:hypothetical protein